MDIRETFTIAEVQEIQRFIEQNRDVDAPFDFCVSTGLPGRDLGKHKEIVAPYEEVGVTWWIEFIYSATGNLESNTERIRLGPPR